MAIANITMARDTVGKSLVTSRSFSTPTRFRTLLLTRSLLAKLAELKVHELVKFHTDIPGAPTLYTSIVLLAMNTVKYRALPAELKKVIDDNSSQVVATMAGKMWDDQAASIEEMVRKRGNTVAAIATEEAEIWRRATEPIVEAWIRQMKARDIDAGKLLAIARTLVAKYEDG